MSQSCGAYVRIIDDEFIDGEIWFVFAMVCGGGVCEVTYTDF